MDSKGNLHFNMSEAEALKRGLIPVRRALTNREVEGKRIAPNSLCGCGSGKKFKKCCYRR